MPDGPFTTPIRDLSFIPQIITDNTTFTKTEVGFVINNFASNLTKLLQPIKTVKTLGTGEEPTPVDIVPIITSKLLGIFIVLPEPEPEPEPPVYIKDIGFECVTATEFVFDENSGHLKSYKVRTDEPISMFNNASLSVKPTQVNQSSSALAMEFFNHEEEMHSIPAPMLSFEAVDNDGLEITSLTSYDPIVKKVFFSKFELELMLSYLNDSAYDYENVFFSGAVINFKNVINTELEFERRAHWKITGNDPSVNFTLKAEPFVANPNRNITEESVSGDSISGESEVMIPGVFAGAPCPYYWQLKNKVMFGMEIDESNLQINKQAVMLFNKAIVNLNDLRGLADSSTAILQVDPPIIYHGNT